MDTSAPSPATTSGSTSTSTRPPRTLAPDLARGLMLALIAMANVSWFLWGRPTAGMSSHIEPSGALDRIVQAIMLIAVDGRSYPLFAFLFGYGMVQFYRSRVQRGIEHRTVRIMLRRRHWAMLLLGFLHAALLFYGDVLGAYGIAGLLLVWIFFGRRDRTIAIWVIVLLALMTLLSLFSMVSGLVLSTMGGDALAPTSPGESPEAFMAVLRESAYGETNYLVSIPVRLSMWALATAQMGLFSVVPLAILIGWLAARHRVLEEPEKHRRLLQRVAIIGIPLGWLAGAPTAAQAIGLFSLPEATFWTFMGVDYVGGLFTALGYAAAFGLIALAVQRRTGAYGSSALPLLPRALTAVGKRSLTCYLFQSVLFVLLMAGYTLGLGGVLTSAGALGTALLVWAASLPLALWMESRDARGPAETLLRRLTYGKHAPVRG